ncbi:hypothetical protein K7432_005356 [Basidiobolus ranarum]|uniref:Uncharacterized protein n=1 Tax=Basidiobolus ranarum TaxID=34480 RepID=A0ABR2W3G6_9FUNG
MMAFLGWVIILNFGPNAKLYPYLQFKKNPEDPYTLEMTLWATQHHARGGAGLPKVSGNRSGHDIGDHSCVAGHASSIVGVEVCVDARCFTPHRSSSFVQM